MVELLNEIDMIKAVVFDRNNMSITTNSKFVPLLKIKRNGFENLKGKMLKLPLNF